MVGDRNDLSNAAAFDSTMVNGSSSVGPSIGRVRIAAAGARAYMMIAMSSTNTIVQTLVEERLRGRVVAFHAPAFRGATPVKSLSAGIVAARAGVPATIAIGGSACVAPGQAPIIRPPASAPLVRQIYIARGDPMGPKFTSRRRLGDLAPSADPCRTDAQRPPLLH